jgi:hypothetical protein
MSYYPPNLLRMQWSFTFALEDMVSPRCLGCLPPRRASAPARHLICTCLAPTWHLLGICFGAPLARCHRPCLCTPAACTHWYWCACSGHLLLGAPTHSASQASNASSTPVSLDWLA